MEPGIKRSIGEGFRAANRSWKGIGFYIAGLLVVTGLAFLGILMTNPPAEVFEGTTGAVEETIPVLDETAETVVADAQAEERQQVVSQWFGRAWFLILLALLVAMAGNLWLSGGQIGYVAKQVTTQQAAVSEFWIVGTRVFLPLLGGTGLAMLGLGGAALLLALFGALAGVLPQAVGGVLGVLVFIGFFVGVIWLVVRLAFWFIAIVADGLSPVAALKASFRATHKRWLRVFGLGVLMMLLSYLVQLPFGLLDWIGGTAGGATASVLGVISGVVGAVASLYVGFITLGAYVRFYQDVKSVQGGGASPTPASG